MDKKDSTTVIARITDISPRRGKRFTTNAGARLKLIEISQNDGCFCCWSPMTLEYRASRLMKLNLQKGDAIEITIRKTKAY